MADSISTKMSVKRTRQEESPEQCQERLKKRRISDRQVENQKLLKNVMLGLTVERPIVNEGNQNQQQRLSTESDDQRAARLAHLSHNQ